MKISVITAVYNREATIAHALDSVQSQDHADVEHLIIDGASTDRTGEIVRASLSPSLRLLSEPDDGIYDAINKGILASRGEVIGLLHSDDRFANQHVLSAVASHFANKDLDAVYADVGFFQAHEPGKVVRRFNSGRFTPQRLAYGWMPAHTALFLRRSVFDRFGLYKVDYKIAADFEFIARVFKNGHTLSHYVPEMWVHMQIGGISTGGLANNILGNREVLRACRENGIRTNHVKILSKYPWKLLEYLAR